MKRPLTRSEIADVLRNWLSGGLTAEQVHAWATEIYFGFRTIDADDEEEVDDEEFDILNEVMGGLDMLNINLMIAEDVPLYLEFLATSPGQFEQGYRKLQEGLDRIDIRARQRALADIPFYAPFCKDESSG